MGRKNDPESLSGMMDTLRKLRGDLEVVCADALRNFEKSTGLTVEDIELIRAIEHMDSNEVDRTRIAAVKITMRL